MKTKRQKLKKTKRKKAERQKYTDQFTNLCKGTANCPSTWSRLWR